MQRGLLIRRGPHFGFGNATSRPFAASFANCTLQVSGYATEPGRQAKEDALGKTIRKESEARGSASSIGWNDSPQSRRGDMRDTQRLEERLMAKESKKSSSKEDKDDQESDDEGDEDREKRGDWYTKQEEQYSESKSSHTDQQSQSQQKKQFDAASDSYNVDNLADGKKEGSSQQDFEKQETGARKASSSNQNEYANSKSGMGSSMSGSSGNISDTNNNIPPLNYRVRARNDNETDIVPDNTQIESKEGSYNLDSDRDLKNRQASSKGSNLKKDDNNNNIGYKNGSGKVGSANQGLELNNQERDIKHESGSRDNTKIGGSSSSDMMSANNINRSGRTSNEAEKAQFGNDDDIVDYKKSGKSGMKSGGAKDTIDVQQEQQDLEHRKEADNDRAPYSKTVKDGKNAKRAERAPGFLDAQS